ncbi:MAG: SAM-dependent methyltransferase [Verrucomicrobia bacterium]|nr:SAM-dependent methyltransferase [Verrucomicrobiota bacterium]
MSPLAQIIASEIHAGGPLPFRRFMELALYHPDWGYYERTAEQIGQVGDFFTSVSVGSLFGELLGFQFAQWQCDSAGAIFQLIEAGAHDGRLACDILNYFRAWQPALYDRLEYWIVEPSLRRQSRQAKQLGDNGGRVRFVRSLDALPANGINGIIFANELLDAFPVTRLGWDAHLRSWFEWGVAHTDDRFVWERMPARTCDGKALPSLPKELLAVLPDGFTTEICPAVIDWWKQASARLKRGHLLTFDYGFCAEQLFAPERAAGTLRGYRRHRVVDDVLADPGEQDITAHINFAALRDTGEAAGLKNTAFVPQSKFLTEIANQTWQLRAPFPDWTAARIRQFQSLTHPDHLGRAFQVLAQTK